MIVEKKQTNSEFNMWSWLQKQVMFYYILYILILLCIPVVD